MAGGFREALLKHDGIEPDALSASEREKVLRLLARDRSSIRWLKCGAAVAWILAFLVFLPGVGTYFFPSPETNPALTAGPQPAQAGVSKLFILRIIMPIEAAALSLWLYLRTRRINRKQLQVALAACEAEIKECGTQNAGRRVRNG